MSGGERRRGCAILVNYSAGFQRWGRSSSDSAGVALARRGRMSFSQFPKARPLALHVAANEYRIAVSAHHGDGGSRGDFFERGNGHKMNAVGL